MDEVKGIAVDEFSPLFDTKGMFFREFPSDYRQIRFFTLQVVQKAPPEVKEINLLEQQVSEMLKNAMKHGNRCDVNKKVRAWFLFNDGEARLVVEDEGEGFQDLEKWNDFHRRRTECFEKQDFETMADYISYRTAESDDQDGGNALFAAVEYWNGGVVYNAKRNKIALLKTFPKRQRGMALESTSKGVFAAS